MGPVTSAQMLHIERAQMHDMPLLALESSCDRAAQGSFCPSELEALGATDLIKKHKK